MLSLLFKNISKISVKFRENFAFYKKKFAYFKCRSKSINAWTLNNCNIGFSISCFERPTFPGWVFSVKPRFHRFVCVKWYLSLLRALIYTYDRWNWCSFWSTLWVDRKWADRYFSNQSLDIHSSVVQYYVTTQERCISATSTNRNKGKYLGGALFAIRTKGKILNYLEGKFHFKSFALLLLKSFQRCQFLQHAE